MNSECCSVQRTSRNRELRMFQKTLEMCLSETHASGNREAQTSDLSFQAILISKCKGDSGKGMKGGHKRRHIKTQDKGSPLCCIDGHPPHSKVRVHPGEYSQEQSQVWKLSSLHERAVHELPEKIDEAGMRAENFNLGQSSTKWLTVVTNEKL